MAEMPLLLFPQAKRILPPKGTGRPPRQIGKPGVAKQKERLGPAFQRLESAFAARRAEINTSASGMEPEKALVIETAGAVIDFQRAVRAIAGLEWLGEFELDDVDSDNDFYDVKDPDRKVSGNLYLAMTDQRAVEEIVRLWGLWESDKQKFPRGKTKWRDLFSLCRDIRYWNADDRLKETGLVARLKKLLSEGQESISIEIELWYRAQERLHTSKNMIVEMLQEEGGKVVADAHIAEIAYSAIKASISAELASQIVDGRHPSFFNEDAIYCLRPEGQCVTSIPDSVESKAIPNRPLPTEPPVVAILDGVPFQRHQCLAGRVELDDPDNFAGEYQAPDQKHGTAMASLVIHGELDDLNAQALKSKVYMRPVMVPNQNRTAEEIPTVMLLVDFLHEAVKGIFDRNDDEDFSTIKVINVSLGDPTRPFSRVTSPWARLLDWLSWKYQVLFCVSTGNFVDDINLGITPNDFTNLDGDDKSRETLTAMAKELSNRRLLSPAESMNAITVGALHHDLVEQYISANRIDIQPNHGLPSPITRLGGGFRNSIKPDIIMSAGRQLYRDLPGQTAYGLSGVGASPGQSVAAPPQAGVGQINRTAYTRGTSNATALASRGAARIHEALREIQKENPGAIPDANLAVLMKAILVHGAAWGDAGDTIKSLGKQNNPENSKRYASRFLGYGAVNLERVLECTHLRATVIGTDLIKADQELEYQFPLPPALSGLNINKRLTITLAWFTPINPGHRNLRQANLFYTPPTQDDYINLSRVYADWQQVKKGTVQHEVLEGDRANAYQDGENLRIPVSFRKDAGDFDESVPFGFAVTLEVLEEVGINIYNEIRDRIPVQVGAPVGAS